MGAGLPRLPRAPKVPDLGKTASERLDVPAPPGLGENRRTQLPQDPEQERQARWQEWRAGPDILGTGSYLEFICWDYLTNRKKAKRGVDYIFQYPFLGGRTQFGGFVADFYFPGKGMVWNPAGLQYHYTEPKNRARDRLAKVMLANKGITIIYLWEDDLLGRPEFTLSNAWNGVQVGRRDI